MSDQRVYTVTITCQAIVVAESARDAMCHTHEILDTETVGMGIEVVADDYADDPIDWPDEAIPYGLDTQETWSTVRRRMLPPCEE